MQLVKCFFLISSLWEEKKISRKRVTKVIFTRESCLKYKSIAYMNPWDKDIIYESID